MPVQPAAAELLVALARVLPRWGRWCVFCAQAVIAYGVPRLSADVDVTIDLVPPDPESFVDSGRTRGNLSRLEEALGQRDLVSEFESIARG